MSLSQRIISYGKYIIHAKDLQRIHSPFVFNLLNQVFYKDIEINERILKIETRRAELLKNQNSIQVTDLGAGAGKWQGSSRKISQIAKNSLKRKKYAQLIYKITHYFQPKTTLELGTSLGVTTAYIGQGYQDGKVISIEGCPNIAQVAKETFAKTQTHNATIYNGNFDDILPKVLQGRSPLDLVFIDGNHAYAPTLSYFEQTLKHAHNDTIFVFDDIHWSQSMEKAWDEIKNHPQVTITIDIYEMGLVFIRKENKGPKHFIIKY